DDPNGENGTCGSSSVVTANPGSQTISLTGGSLKALTSCTVSVSLVSSQVGVLVNNTGPVGSSAGSSTSGDTESLTVLPPPTVTVSGMKNHARYAYGAVIKPKFSCAQAGDPSALSDCSSADDLGNDISSGGSLKTRTPGRHSLAVTATSSDGLSTTDTINYTVLPDNRITLAAVKPAASGALGLRVSLPGPGKLTVLELAGHKLTAGRYSVRVAHKRSLRLNVKPTPAGAALLAGGSAKVTVRVIFTPKNGVERTVTRHGVVLSSG
ncbi:MAG: hypothetical protein WAK93_15620, partial [Solirubrobacteraceae bacterium]